MRERVRVILHQSVIYKFLNFEQVESAEMSYGIPQLLFITNCSKKIHNIICRPERDHQIKIINWVLIYIYILLIYIDENFISLRSN